MSLAALDGQSLDEITAWLNRALSRREPLPRAVPDEFPEDAILRAEEGLRALTREDLRTAADRLVAEFVRNPSEDDDYVASLLHMAASLQRPETARELARLATSPGFGALRRTLRQRVLGALLELRAPVDADFWLGTARSDAELAVLCFAAAADANLTTAAQILPLIPNDQVSADAVYVILDQATTGLKVAEKQAWIAAMSGATGLVAEAVGDWALNSRGSPPPRPSHPALDRAFRRRDPNSTPTHQSARVVGARSWAARL